MTGWQNFGHLSDEEQMESRAYALADNHFEMRRALVMLRMESGMTQKDVADFLGITPQGVAKYERYDWDPLLSTLERYANAVGAVIQTQVIKDDGAQDLPVMPQEMAPAPAGVVWHEDFPTKAWASKRTTAQWLTRSAWNEEVSMVGVVESKRSDFAKAA